MKERILNKKADFFKTVVSVAVLIGFLGIQFHSFIHHHDVHNHLETGSQSTDDIIIDISSNDEDTESVECLTCVLTKHVNTISNTSAPYHSVQSELISVSVPSNHAKDVYFISLSLRGPPLVV